MFGCCCCCCCLLLFVVVVIMSTRKGEQRNLFVGNIPYDSTEEQLLEIFREAGPVAHFK